MNTPYQGKKRCFGFYRCWCKNQWHSAYSWSNTIQECKVCSLNVYPYRQQKLDKPVNIKIKKNHIQELCGKCRMLDVACNVKYDKTHQTRP
jgi:hypothetical protein